MMDPGKRREPLAGGSTTQSEYGSVKTSANPPPAQAEPEFGKSWHGFVAWALMAGYTTPQRVAEVVLAEVDEIAL